MSSLRSFQSSSLIRLSAAAAVGADVLPAARRDDREHVDARAGLRACRGCPPRRARSAPRPSLALVDAHTFTSTPRRSSLTTCPLFCARTCSAAARTRAGSISARSDVPVVATWAISCRLDLLDGAERRRVGRGLRLGREDRRPTDLEEQHAERQQRQHDHHQQRNDLAILAPQNHAPECNSGLGGTRGSEDPSWGRDPDSTFTWDLFGSGQQRLSFVTEPET